MLYALMAGLMLAFPVSSAPKMGSYVATKFNDAPLPGVATLQATEGFRHWVKLEQAIVRLQQNGKFTASFRYQHQHLQSREKPVRSQILSRTYSGRYTVKGNTISFIPVNTGSKQPLAPFPGTIDASGMHVRYSAMDGGIRHNLKLDLRFDPSYW
ncbi:MAG: hypothetical protein H0U64_03715 [Gemmatimonadaceae bacterium]|nr:hypothetical protein [Gemmatimonadaceae bacterium]